jgi:PAS domain S-box-containing protein
MLQQAKEDWETTFDSIDDPITIHDKNMNVIRANAAARKIIGLQTSDIIGQKCYTLYHGTTTAPGNCPSCSTLQSNKPSIAEIFEPHLHKYLEIKTFPRIDSNNKTIGIIHIARDISNRKRAEEKQQILQAQLLQSQKMEAIGQLAGGVAHDFNNLLTGIIGFVGLAKDQVEENSPISADLRETLDLAKRASSLTRQLLAFSRRQILAPEPVNLNDLVIDMSKMLKRLIGEDITLDLRPAGSIFLINADPGQIEQVLVNLTVNSRQAMPSGGALTIATTNVMLDETESILRKVDIPEGSYVMLTVTDTGIGIDQEIQQQIFDPFFTTKEVGIGSGLGLSTVYGIIKQHKGFVWVDSEPGKGATFIIYLPAAETIAAGTKTKMTVRSKESPTILVVEDDVAVLQVTERMLNNLGFSVLTAVSPDEAEKIFSHRTDTISLLLTDVILPTKNGKELYKSLQRIKPSLAILYMSGHTQDTLIQKNILAPDSPFIKKPFSQEDLEQRLTYLTP